MVRGRAFLFLFRRFPKFVFRSLRRVPPMMNHCRMHHDYHEREFVFSEEVVVERRRLIDVVGDVFHEQGNKRVRQKSDCELKEAATDTHLP